MTSAGRLLRSYFRRKPPVVYLHVGAPKTGTTTLQSLLFRNRDHLMREYSTLVPMVGSRKNLGAVEHYNRGHHILVHAARAARKDNKRATERFKKLMDDLHKEIQSSGCASVIISSEKLTTSSSQLQKLLVESLSRYELHVVASVRRVDEYVDSIIRQQAKGGAVPNLARGSRKYPFISLFMWDQLIGREKMHVVAYDQPDRAAFMDRMLDALGVGGLLRTGDPAPSTNHSLSSAGFLVADALRELEAESTSETGSRTRNRFVARLLEIERELPRTQGTYVLSAAVRKERFDQHLEESRRLADSFLSPSDATSFLDRAGVGKSKGIGETSFSMSEAEKILVPVLRASGEGPSNSKASHNSPSEKLPASERRAKRLILHIGMPKTGSSTIQGFLATNRKSLASRGVCYPRSPGKRNHLCLSAYAFDDERMPNVRRLVGVKRKEDLVAFRKRFVEEFHGELQGNTCPTIILSNEHCTTCYTSEEVERLRDLLSPLADRVEIFFYVRRQDDTAAARLSTAIKFGSSNDRPPMRFEMYDAYGLAERYAQAFGRENVRVAVFERSQFKKGDLLEDFMSRLNLGGMEGLEVVPDSNKSLDAKHMEFLRRLNAYLPRFVEGTPSGFRSDIGRLLETLSDGPTAALPESEVAPFFAQYEEGNQKLAREYLGRDDGILFQNPRKTKNVVPPHDLSVDEAFEIFGALWKLRQTTGSTKTTKKQKSRRRSRIQTNLRRHLRGLKRRLPSK